VIVYFPSLFDNLQVKSQLQRAIPRPYSISNHPLLSGLFVTHTNLNGNKQLLSSPAAPDGYFFMAQNKSKINGRQHIDTFTCLGSNYPFIYQCEPNIPLYSLVL